jgi:hypothetical protein
MSLNPIARSLGKAITIATMCGLRRRRVSFGRPTLNR